MFRDMKSNLLAGALIAVGLCLGGLFIYLGISKIASKDRAVSVKGLSTREVKADYAVWPLSFAWSGNDLPALYEKVEQVTARVKKHLLALGFEEADIRQGSISVNNNWDSYYGNRPEFKYTLSTSLIVSTDKMIEEATQNARAVAQKFAEDAKCNLGSIRRASQGQFSVESDQYQPWVKHVRVVTTVDYFLD